MKPTLKHIAEATGVSLATASNALNNRKGVSEEVRSQVLRTAMELGYVKLPAAGRSLFRLIVFKRHGMVVGDTPFFSALIEGLERQSRSMGYDLAVSHTSASEADRKEFQDLLFVCHSIALISLLTT